MKPVLLPSSLSDDDFLELLVLLLLIVVRKLVENFFSSLGLEITVIVESLSSDSSGEVHILLHDGNSGSVNCAEVSIFEETSEVALSSFLKGDKSLGLEAELSIDTVADSTDESLEGSSQEHERSGLLVSLDLS